MELLKITDRQGNIIRIVQDSSGYIYPAGICGYLVSTAYGYSFSIQDALKKV